MADGEVRAQDLTAETTSTLSGNEQFVMFDSTEGKRADIDDVATYIAGDKTQLQTTDKSSPVAAINENHGAITDLKEDIEDLESNVTHINRFNKDNVLNGYYLSTTNGTTVPLDGYIVSDYMDIADLTSVRVSNVHIACFYNSSKTFISSSVQSPVEAEYTITVPANTKYMRFSVYGGLANTAQVGKDISRSNYVPYKDYTIPNATIYTNQIVDSDKAGFDDAVVALVDSSYARERINLFDKTVIYDDTYIVPTNGGTGSASGFFASDYIDISAYSAIKVSKTHLFALYKADKTYLSAPSNTNSINNDLTVDVSSASYIRFSTYDEYLNTAQVGKDITSAKYVPYSKYFLNGLVVNGNQVSNDYTRIVVSADGSGDYTSFTEALYDNVDSGVDILVKAGTYDIVSEYVALFGQTAVDNMADADSAIFNGFQYGVILRNRKIEFAAGAHLVCDWTGHTVDGTHRFSALAVCYNVEIIGLDLVSTHTFYAIHDDYGLWDSPYTVKYENCRIKGINIVNANCIGGGCKPFSRHIINNCYFDNGINDSVVRYHNTNVAGAEPEIYVSNSFFNSKLSFNYYGSQTTKMKAYVNNCKANSIIKAQESISFSTDNVELYKWCCDETA